MSGSSGWPRRRVLAGLGAAPWLGCARAGSERRPPRVGGELSVRLPSIVHGELERGPSLYLVEDHGVPLVSVAVAVPAGHGHERPGQEGRAAMAAKMLLEGMQGGSRAALLDRYGELGTTPFASAMASNLLLRCTVHRDDAAAALRLMCDNLRAPTGAQASFDRVMLEQRESLEAARGVPEAVAGFGLLLGSQGVEPPAALLSDGTRRSLSSIELDHVRAWLPPRLGADGLTFLVAGDVDESEVLRWVDGAIQGGTTVASESRPAPPVPVAVAEDARPRVVLVPWPRLPQGVLALGGPRLPYGDRGEPAEALAEAMMAGLTQYELRTRQRISYGVQSRSWITKRGPVAQLWAKVEPADVGRAVQRLREYLERLQQELQFTEEAIAEVRQAATVGSMDDFHGAEPALGELMRLAEYGLPARMPQQRLQWLHALRAQDVTLALRRVYHPDRVRLCVVGDDAVMQRARAVLPSKGVVERTPAQLFGLDEVDDAPPVEETPAGSPPPRSTIR